MIVKIHSRGAGSGSGPVDYLLGKDRQREQASVLRGNPEHVRELIDGCDFARAYTSGVLSFQEPDIADAEKSRLMDEWEHTLLPGLDRDQYACLWVEHRDKGRLELNFVIPNIELQSGKRLQPYFDRADRPRVNAWQTLTNDRLGLRDPNDPTYRRPLTQASDLPRDKQQAAEKITAGLMNLMQQGVIRSRQDVVTQLESYGLTVARETKSSISIADPDGGRNIRLKGMIYERDFKFGEGLRGEIEAAGAGYRAEREARVREAGDVYQRGTAIKLAEHQQRYPRAERQADGHAQEVSLNSDGWIFFCFALLIGIMGGIIWFQGTIITSRLSEMDSYSQQLANLKAKSGAGVTIYSDDTRRNTYLVVLPKQAHGVETYTSTTDNTVVKYTAK
ncbi:relaxase/mobilization nuclease domain-containing protein [Salmonella enterica subsp. enterica serovar Derby]|nr:relaxase/mobilization nuclease domain-containing protein [Salmonella enterica subsp. enterica serovar Derby]